MRVVVIGGIVYYLEKDGEKEKVVGVGVGLMLGGGIGKFIEGILGEEVVDFVDLVFGDYDYGMF
ncbi:signal peptidase II, partial [Bacillus altitudinis]|uniref:signal peptidase II n=1 Tax=Bacillus altitudinis TaxID=293387 RepID=UPI001F354D1C